MSILDIDIPVPIMTLLAATLFSGICLVVAWMIYTSSRSRIIPAENTVGTEEFISLKSQVRMLTQSLKEVNKEREHLWLIAVSQPRFTRLFMNLNSLEEVGETLVKALCRTLNCQKALIFLSRNGELRPAGSMGIGDSTRIPDAIQEGEGRTGWVAKVQVLMGQADFTQLSNIDKACVQDTETLGETFDVYVPIISSGQTLGVFCATGSDVRKKSAMGTLSSIADIASLAIENQFRLQKIQHLSETDAGTGLYNRHFFNERIKGFLGDQTQKTCCVLLLDIDRFKRFNDTYGHLVGDDVLRHVGSLIQGSIESGELACRYGGEEFILVFKSGKKEAISRAEMLRKKIQDSPLSNPDHGDLIVTTSGGLAEYPIDGYDVTRLTKRADERLYRAKNAGRNRIIHSDASPQKKVSRSSPGPKRHRKPRTRRTRKGGGVASRKGAES